MPPQVSNTATTTEAGVILPSNTFSLKPTEVLPMSSPIPAGAGGFACHTSSTTPTSNGI
jgi:hypothetical protein